MDISGGFDTMTSIADERVREEVNNILYNELEDLILAPETGIMRVRKVLQRYGLDMPALYALHVDGDEMVISLDQIDTQMPVEDYFLYLIYYLTDEQHYEFYAEITDDDGIEEILSEDEDEEDDK
jgi:hypothetical protein